MAIVDELIVAVFRGLITCLMHVGAWVARAQALVFFVLLALVVCGVVYVGTAALFSLIGG